MDTYTFIGLLLLVLTLSLNFKNLAKEINDERTAGLEKEVSGPDHELQTLTDDTQENDRSDAADRGTADQHCMECYGSCSTCMEGWYGEYCNLTCNNTCDNGQTCHRWTGICSSPTNTGSYVNITTKLSFNCSSCNGACGQCHYGWYGTKCDAKCKNCSEHGCNKTTGDCFKCEDGLCGTNCSEYCPKYCDPPGCNRKTHACYHGCSPGKCGDNCTELCSDGCSNGCKFDCSCDCTSGRYGDTCNQTCSRCLDQRCNSDGTCLEGCKPNFTGAKCSRCAVSFYGVDCMKRCGIGCLHHNCSANGTCDCHPLYYGDDCTTPLCNCNCNCNCNYHYIIIAVTVIVIFILCIGPRRIRRFLTDKCTNEKGSYTLKHVETTDPLMPTEVHRKLENASSMSNRSGDDMSEN